MNKNIKKAILAFLVVTLPLSMSGCYQPDLEYKPVEVGQLQAPKVALGSDEYREVYPEMERYPETVTLDVAVCEFPLDAGVDPQTTTKNQSFNEVALEKLNIKLNYIVSADSSIYEEKIRQLFIRGKAPDMFYITNPAMYTELKDGGNLADLTETFWHLNDDLQSNYLDHFQQLLPACMENSKLYALPTLSNTYESAQRLYIRKDWLDICGISKLPTTMEEFYEVGKAFADNKDKIAAATGILENQVKPFTMNKQLTWAGSYSIEGFLNCYGTSVDAYFEGENGELYYSNTSQEMKNALAMLRKMYVEGILEKGFTNQSAEKIQGHIKAGFVGMVFGEWWMAKDVLDDCVNNVNGADWVWVDLPTAEGVEAKPIVESVKISGYNVVSSTCKHPEAAAKLINLFYDMYYNDNATEIYEGRNLPSNKFFYQFVPIKLWDAVASIKEYERVQEVFNELVALNFDPSLYVPAAEYEKEGIVQTVTTLEDGDYLINKLVDENNADNVTYEIIHREVIAAIEANALVKAQFDKLKSREKTLHFADGYPYFYAYAQGKRLKDMNAGEKQGWGIYHEMIDPTGGYAYVVELTNGLKEAKYDCFYGASLAIMKQNSETVTKRTDTMFTKIIIGQMTLDEFDSVYVAEIKPFQDPIMPEVNKWYKNHAVDLEHVYALINNKK